MSQSRRASGWSAQPIDGWAPPVQPSPLGLELLEHLKVFNRLTWDLIFGLGSQACKWRIVPTTRRPAVSQHSKQCCTKIPIALYCPRHNQNLLGLNLHSRLISHLSFLPLPTPTPSFLFLFICHHSLRQFYFLTDVFPVCSSQQYPSLSSAIF